MNWTGDTFAPLLHVAQLHAVYNDLTALMQQASGAPSPSGVWSLNGNLSVSSQLLVAGQQVQLAGAVGGVDSAALYNATSGYNLRGFPTKQLLQRIVVPISTTSRGSVTATYSTYMVGSITPVSSLSTLYVKAWVDVFITGNATPVTLGTHLMRNPAMVASFGYLTNSLLGNQSNTVGGGIGIIQNPGTAAALAARMSYDCVDSATNVDPKQFGIDWNNMYAGAAAGITAGGLVIEEWL